MELRLRQADGEPSDTYREVERLAKLGSGARFDFSAGTDEQKREVLATVLCNAQVRDGEIVSYQWKDPFGVLKMDSSGAFCHPWWALEDLNL